LNKTLAVVTICIFLLGMALPFVQASVSVVFYATESTWVDQHNPDSTHAGAANTELIVTPIYDGDKTRDSLVKFDLSTIPAGAVIVSAKLKLNGYGSSGLPSTSVDVHRVTSAWGEATATWTNMPSFRSLASDSVHLDDLNSGAKWYSFDVTSDVQETVGGTADFGWLFSSGNTEGYFFSTRTLHYKPVLEVEYDVLTHAVPEAPFGTISLAAVFAVAFVGVTYVKRRRTKKS
jgi:hypothetical protein